MPEVRRPRRRDSDLLVRDIDDELIVHDTGSDRITHLDRETAAVWRLCDGRTDVAGLAQRAGSTEAEVSAALVRLQDADLLVGTGVDRRALLRGAAAVAWTVPLVTIVAPTAAQAASPPSAPNFGQFTHICRGSHTESFRIPLTGFPPNTQVRLNTTWSPGSGAINPNPPDVNVATTDGSGAAVFRWTFVSTGQPVRQRTVTIVSYQIGMETVPVEGISYTGRCP